ncbi:Oxygen sensor protein DosP [compost metagenome]
MTTLLLFQSIAFSLFPLYFTTLPGAVRRVHFYVYISLVLLIGGFMGNVYALPVIDGAVISGGNLCYGAFMMASVMFVWVERDAFILRRLVRLVILVDIFKVVFSFLTQTVLETSGVINPHGVPSKLFEISTPLIVLGGVLIITELLILLFIFELTKKMRASLSITAAIYILSFTLVLILDGIVFPFVAFGINANIASVVIGGLAGKALMAAAFSLPLALFVIWRRRAFVEYLQSDTVRWRLLASTSADLIKEMDRKDQDARRGDIVFQNSTEGLAIVDRSGLVLKANAAFQDMLEIPDGTAGTDIGSLKGAFWQDNAPLQCPPPHTDGWRGEVTSGRDRRRPGILSIIPTGEMISGDETYVYSLTDITEQKTAQERLEYLASHDQLTGLPNRRVLDQRLLCLRGERYALFVVGLDHFKDVNDSYGHGVGDRMLQVVANRLDTVRQLYLRPEDIVCRIGGDEFALLIHSEDRAFIEGNLEKVQLALSQTIRLDDSLELFSSATIGVSYQPRPGAHDALLEADAALHAAKRNRRGSVVVYEDRLTTESQKKMKLGLKLKNALANNELEVHYQPQFDAVTHTLHGVEALARWTDPELGVVPPSDFIPVAEENGLIETLGEYVLERACRDGQEWLQEGYAPITVSVNISASQLRVGRFVSVLPKTLAETGFPANRLEIEITESSYIEREDEVTPFLQDLKRMGVSIAIDDFGTGYSSLSYLRDMPLNCIKIDRSFIVNIPDDTKQCSLTSAIIKLAKVMSFKVVAEGVETRKQLDFLAAEGCDLIQGYYFAKPLPKAELVLLLSRDSQSVERQ